MSCYFVEEDNFGMWKGRCAQGNAPVCVQTTASKRQMRELLKAWHCLCRVTHYCSSTFGQKQEETVARQRINIALLIPL